MQLLENIYTRYRFEIIFCIVFLLFVCVFLIPLSFTFAQRPPVGTNIGAGGESSLFGKIFGLAWKGFDLALAPLAYLMWAVSLGIGGLVAGFGGILLDFTFYHTILQMGSYLSTTDPNGLGVGIIGLWGVVRDVLNILFIFGFIYVGLKTILDAHNSETQRTLGYLLVAALLVNFSLYITQIIVDFTNILSVQIYNQIVASELTKTAFQSNFVELSSGSIAGAFLQLTSLTTFFGGQSVVAGMTNMQSVIFAIFTLLFLIIAGVILGLAAFLLITRFIAIILFMILSPLMFAGWVFPAFHEAQNEWWNKFFHYAFFPPALLFMIYLSLMVLNRMHALFLSNSTGFTGVMQGGGMPANTVTLVMFFFVAIGFLYGSIKIANSMGIAGAEGSLHLLSETRGMAQAFAYRNTAGRLLGKVTDAIDSANRTSEDSNSTAGQKRRALALRVLTGGEQGRKTIKDASNYGWGGHGREHMEHDEHERKKRAARGIQIHNIEHALDPHGHTSQIDKEKAMRDASTEQLIEMIEHHHDKEIIDNAGLLSDSQVAAILKSDKIDDATKGKIATARGAQTAERLQKTNQQPVLDQNGQPQLDANGVAITRNGTMPEVIGKADVSDLKAMGFDNAKTHAGHLTAKQIEDWKDLTPTEKKQLKDERKSQLNAEFNAGAGASSLFGRITSDEERSKLPDSILTHTDAAQYLNTNVLAKIVDNSGITAAQRAAIKNEVLRAHAGNAQELRKYQKFFSQNNAGQRY